MYPHGLIMPVKAGLGEFIGLFYLDFVADTAANEAWRSRGYSKAVNFAEGRMIDFAEDILSEYRKNNNTGKLGSASPLPLMVLCVDKGYTPVTGDFGGQTQKTAFIFPEDELNRVFHLKVMRGDIRVQIVIFAAEEVSARGIVSQLLLFLSSPNNRRFQANYSFEGFTSGWSVKVQTPDITVSSIPHGEQSNLTILTLDLTLTANMPLFYKPSATDLNDGKGDSVTGKSNGFAVVKQVDGSDKLNDKSWQVGGV